MASESSTPRYDPCHKYGDLYKCPQDKTNGKAMDSEASQSSSSNKKPPLQSMLVTGFGLRSWDSLQRALLDDEQRKQMLLARHDTREAYECESVASSDATGMYTLKSPSKATLITQDVSVKRFGSLSLEYLMGLEQEGEAEAEGAIQYPPKLEEILGEAEEEVHPKMSDSMRKARKYLKDHRIFDFFKFLIAHMLSDLPDNPIEFLTDLLDRCLLYRSGFGEPPLLFEKPHLEQLFYLMDPMRIGFIEVEQYHTGMKTLGICSYDKNPPLSTENLVSKDFFIEEAYDSLTDLFVEMIRRRGGISTPPSLVTPPPTAAASGVSAVTGGP